MVAIPTITDEHAKRPGRERQSLVGEESRIGNRMKATLARLGIRGFNPKLKKAADRVDGLRTPEGETIPPNTLAELRRDMERRRFVRDQIQQIERARLEQLERAPSDGPHAMVRLLARVIGVGIETADMLVQEVLSRNLRDRRAVGRYAGLTGSPDESGSRRVEKGLARSGNVRVRPLCPVARCANQRVIALLGWCLSHSQAAWIIVPRTWPLPVRDIPWDRSTSPLSCGLVARPRKPATCRLLSNCR
jgi:transposase